MNQLTPEDLRNATWQTLQPTLHGRLLDIYNVWLQHGPGTTRAVALRSARDLLSLRPRTTDLYHLGLVELIGSQAGEGLYRARTKNDWDAWHATQPGAITTQINLI